MYKLIFIIIFLLPTSYFIYLIIIYSRTKVPYIVTPKKYFPIIFKNIKIIPQTVIYDLGCGKGDFLFAAEKLNPHKLIGFELLPLQAWYGVIKSKILKSKVKIYCQDFFKVDISEADIIYLFLVKPVLIKTWQKIEKEAKKGTLIITLSDSIPKAEYIKVFKSQPDKEKSSKIYIYQKM